MVELPFDQKVLPIPVRAELKGLPTELADIVGAHLVAAAEAMEVDPALALRHAQAARRRAARMAVTREAVAEAAYAAGEWSVALNEFRSLRRMTGDTAWLPVMADCERALERPQAALRLVAEAAELGLPRDQAMEMRIIEAGARADLGQTAEAARVLRRSLAEVERRPGPERIRVGYAYADRLLESGDTKQGGTLFRQVADWDVDGITDAAARCDELEGFHFDLSDSDAAPDDDPDDRTDENVAALGDNDQVDPAGGEDS
ncbi:hypothetical protein ACQBAU_11140 [Propionibacteriaceae bacterium Y2011]